MQGLQVHMDIELIHRFMGHLLRLPLAFFLQRRSGDLLQRAASLGSLRSFFTSRSIGALVDGLQVIGFGALMVAWQPFLGSLILVLAAARVTLTLSLRNWFRQVMATELAAGGREQAVLLECLGALETIKACHAEERMVERWTGRMVARVNAGIRRRKLELWSDAGVGLFKAGSIAIITWIGGLAVIEDRISLGIYAAFMVMQSMVSQPLESLLSAYGEFLYLGNHLLRLDDVMDTEREPQGGQNPGRLQGGIELENVSFRYDPGSPWAVDGVTIRIQPGEKVALVGPSGAGKSTLARLIMGMHLPARGTIRFDGRAMETLDLESLRNQMGVVLQETFLFNDTVRVNLSLNQPKLELQHLRDAADQACILETIEALPGGFESLVGEDGSCFSGGQRQRLSLARALAHDPAILLLDEATSALDMETEARLHANLAAKGCTRLIIAHRIEAVRDADRILVLDQGRLVQQGRYADLVQEPGLFQQLFGAREKAHGF
jgi:ABC-type bacteriocin/lantibiotic exporter with double-glycine peptidase domain